MKKKWKIHKFLKNFNVKDFETFSNVDEKKPSFRERFFRNFFRLFYCRAKNRKPLLNKSSRKFPSFHLPRLRQRKKKRIKKWFYICLRCFLIVVCFSRSTFFWLLSVFRGPLFFDCYLPLEAHSSSLVVLRGLFLFFVGFFGQTFVMTFDLFFFDFLTFWHNSWPSICLRLEDEAACFQRRTIDMKISSWGNSFSVFFVSFDYMYIKDHSLVKRTINQFTSTE